MFKRYRFILALMVCLCVFAYDTVSISSDWGGGSFACAAEGDVVLDTTNFDEPFLTALIAILNNIDGITNKGSIATNSTLSAEDVQKVTAIDLSSATNKTSITSLKGIEYFTALTTLNASGCTGLTTLDVTALMSLTSLDVSGCSALTWLKYYCDTKVTGYSLTVALRQVTLDGSINMAFYVPMTQANATNDSFTKTATFSGGASGGTFRSDLVSNDASGNPTHYAFAGEVTSIQMADPITAEIHVGDDETVTFAGYTVKKYLDALISGNAYSANTKALANAIKNYGYYAQATLRDTNTSYGSHISMDKASEINSNDISGTTIVPITGKTADAGVALSDYAISVSNGDKSNVSYTLDLDSKIALHVYLNSTIFPEGATAEAAVKKVIETTDSTGSITTYTRTTYPTDGTNVTPTKTTDGAYTVLSFNDIPAHEIDNIYTITINNGTTITISPLSYVYAVLQLEYTTQQAALKEMGIESEPELNRFKQAVIAFYNYYKATVAYRVAPNS